MGGFFGVAAKSACRSDVFYGTDYHSHLGTRRAGMATVNAEGRFSRSIHNIEGAYFRNKFAADLPKFDGESGIGIISDTDSQPIILHSHLGSFAIVTVGRINNLREIEAMLLKRGINFTELSSGDINPSEVIGQLVTTGSNFTEGLQIVHQTVEGSCSILLLTRQGVIASRDRYGRTPIVMGKRDDRHPLGQAMAFASESSAFPNLGFETVSYLSPGEIVLATADSCTVLAKPPYPLKICALLFSYYGFPSSDYENINVDEVRYRFGMTMGKNDPVPIDCVCSIPDSGTSMAIGYARGKQVPYRRGIVKYTPTWPRSFTPASGEERKRVAHMKLIPNRAILNHKRLACCDDSIVRGTQLHDNAGMLYRYGAREIHVRISCPPLIFPCPYINFSITRTELELISRRHILSKEGRSDACLDRYSDPNSEKYSQLIESIRQELNVTSLVFNTLDNFKQAIGLPGENICTYCFNGRCR